MSSDADAPIQTTQILPDLHHHRQPVRARRGSKRGFKGFDAGKKIHAGKRHILTDTDGSLLRVEVHGADV